MELIGEIALLQVQVVSLKVGEPNRRRYDPAGIRSVASLRLDPDGVEGVTDDARLPDVHNATHPDSKNRRGSNGISIGFTSHYHAIRGRFGEHLPDGIAAENILVTATEPNRIFQQIDFINGIGIATEGGDMVRLHDVIVAAPCVEFSRYALQFPDDAKPDLTVTAAVQFLGDGIRGFYLRAAEPATIALGNRVYAL